MLPAHAPAWALSRVVALKVDLDDSNEDNGPLRVIRGSHVLGMLTDQDVLNYASTHQKFRAWLGAVDDCNAATSHTFFIQSEGP